MTQEKSGVFIAIKINIDIFLLKFTLFAINNTMSDLNGIERVKASGNNLTSREQEIFELLLEGDSSKEIAFKLNISSRTVDYHRNNIYKKTDVHNYQELIAKYGSAKRISEIALLEKSENIPSFKNKFFLINKKRIAVPVLAGIIFVSIFIIFFLKPSPVTSKPSNVTEIGKAIAVSFVSEDEPFIVTLNDDDPIGYSARLTPFPDDIRINDRDHFLIYFTFISNADIDYLTAFFVDTLDESGNYFAHLSPNNHLKSNVKANIEYKGAASVFANRTASSTKSNSNILSLNAYNYSGNQPTITFTKFEIIRLARN